MLPFLKNREGGASAPVETVEREPDEGFDTLDAVAEDIIEAVKKGDKAMLKGALSAFADHIQNSDTAEDPLLMEGI